MKLLHNSQQEAYRSPFGALPVGGAARLALAVWEEDTEEGDWLTEVYLRLWRDGEGEQLLPMRPEQNPGRPGERQFVVNLPPQEEPGLLWYYFMLRTAGGELLFYGNNSKGLGGEGAVYPEQPPSYQITVYRPEEAPAWYRRAVCYQIFPDRFARGDDWQLCQQRAYAEGWRGAARVIQQSWQDTPFYSYDEAGRVVRWPHFGGNLQGVRGKLLYLKSLGVSAIYLNPIFRAASNHKYDTADYRRIDPGFGTEEDFCALAADCDKLGIRLILDGVFSHTGEDSRYFNKLGNYPDLGAYQSPDSLYYNWYKFRQYPDDYAAWWGVESLPEVDEHNEDFRNFIFGAEDSVVRHWLRLGAGGWRLDVADELPEDFIRGLRAAATAEKPDALILGEVWEDASNKKSYGEQRAYLLGGSLHATMNYPFRSLLLAWLLGEETAAGLAAGLLSLKENYPPAHFAAALNLIGSHDTPRVLTVLGGAAEPADKTAAEHFRLSAGQRSLAAARLKLAALLQFTMQGVPSVYYGDEAGAQGFADPFNRGTYPWGEEDEELLGWYRRISALRAAYPLLAEGEFWPHALSDDVYACRRFWPQNKQDISDNEEIWVLFNRGESEQTISLAVGDDLKWGRELLSDTEAAPEEGELHLTLPPLAAQVWLLAAAEPKTAELPRAAGVLCHITSLPPAEDGWPSACRRFIDYLAMAGQKLWQVLPLNPVNDSLSPYTPLSVFAGEEKLAAELLDKTDWAEVSGAEYAGFCRENAFWLEDYALYSAIRAARGGLCWQRWPKKERDRIDLPRLKQEYAAEMEQTRRAQFLFWRAWAGVRAYAAQHKVLLIGDLPVYAAPEGADVWANRELFLLDDEGYQLLSAGVPPDYFAKEGQNWGHPVYNWPAMQADNYQWWQDRLRLAFARFDYLRLDHFRSFAAFYAIPKGAAATEGCWLSGPGYGFFRALEKSLGRLPIIAEDLGLWDKEVENLLRLAAYPGMAVYQFAPEVISEGDLTNRVLYSGTHDNQTLTAWLLARGGVAAAEEQRAHIAGMYRSAAPWVVIPLQDMLGLGDEARMNRPGVAEGNWRWQADWQQLKIALAAEFAALIKAADR